MRFLFNCVEGNFMHLFIYHLLLSWIMLQAKNEKIEQLEIDLNTSLKVNLELLFLSDFSLSLFESFDSLIYLCLLQQVEKFQELYQSEQEEKLNVQNELKDCKVNVVQLVNRV